VRKAAPIGFTGTDPEFGTSRASRPDMLKPGRHYTTAGMYTYAAPGTIAMVDFDGGIISLAFQGGGIGIGSLPYALGTGCFIGTYSVTDGMGARLAGTSLGYTVWMCLLWGVLAPPVYAAIRDWRSMLRGPRETWVAAGGGVVSLIAYGIIIYAMSLGAMGLFRPSAKQASCSAR
jgi:hypothetical protein